MKKAMHRIGYVGKTSFGNAIIADFDLVVLFCLLMADVRVFNGSEIASFKLLELLIWGYCAPFVVARVLLDKARLPASCLHFLLTVCLYMAWLLIASFLAIAFREDTEVLQNTKNVIPALVMVIFLFVRLHDIRSVVFLCNLYIVYCLLSCLVAFLQYKFGAPYFRELIVGTEYKLNIDGVIMDTPVVGLSDHPNGLAMAILPGMALSVMKLREEVWDSWRIRPITIAVIMVLAAGMAMSQAKGDMLFTLVAIVFVVSPLGRTRAFPIKFAYISMFIICVMLYTFCAVRQGAAAGADTVETRYLLWQTAFKAVMSDGYILFFGDGTKFVEKWSLPIAGWEFPDSHNAWIDQVLFFGLPALVLYLAVWWQFFRIVEAPTATRSSVERALVDGLRASIVALMGAYFFEPVANVVFNVSQLFFLMSLAVRIIGFNERPIRVSKAEDISAGLAVSSANHRYKGGA